MYLVNDLEIMRRNRLKSVRNDFRYRADAFRALSDEPSPTLRVGSHLSHNLAHAALPR